MSPRFAKFSQNPKGNIELGRYKLKVFSGSLLAQRTLQNPISRNLPPHTTIITENYSLSIKLFIPLKIRRNIFGYQIIHQDDSEEFTSITSGTYLYNIILVDTTNLEYHFYSIALKNSSHLTSLIPIYTHHQNTNSTRFTI